MTNKFPEIGYGYGEAKRQLLSDDKAESFRKRPFPEQYAFDAVLMNLSELVHTTDQEVAAHLWKAIAQIASDACEFLE